MSANLHKLIDSYYKFAGKIVDKSDLFSRKRQENKDKEQSENIVDEFGSAKTEPAEEDDSPIDISKANNPESFHNLINQDRNVWPHRFSNVRKDDEGFFILKQDSPVGIKMKPGDQIADEALNLTPYWEVASINKNRINLKPIGTNPFLTGVGAGGAKLNKLDVQVFTGEYERKRIEQINKKIEKGNVTVDDLVYILDGTVPVNMGPNGAQGGWYAIGDWHTRGAAKRMSEKEIMMADAKKLSDFGIDVPKKALDGTMTPQMWSDWIGGETTHRVYYKPKNVDKYLDFNRKMTQKGRWNYSEEDLAAKRKDLTADKLDDLEKEYDQIIEDFTHLSHPEFVLKHKNDFCKYKTDWTLKEIMQTYESTVNSIKKDIEKETVYMTQNEDESIESILKNVFNKERRVAIRNVLLLIEMAKEDESYIKYLYDFVKLGGSDWLGNEEVIKFFDLIDDTDGLKLCLEYLKDGTNQRYAAGYLVQKGEFNYLISNDTVKNDFSMEGLYGIFTGLTDKLRDKTITVDQVLGALDKLDIESKILDVLNSPKKDTQQNYYSQELCAAILSIIRTVPYNERKQYDDVLNKYRTFYDDLNNKY